VPRSPPDVFFRVAVPCRAGASTLDVRHLVPLFAIAVAFIALRRRLSMTERAAKALKA
jgi:hypothetical protein